MKYFLWMGLFLTVPFFGMAQNPIGGTEFREVPSTTQTFLNPSLVEGQLFMDLSKSYMGQPMLLTRIGRLHRYETKQVVFRKYGNQIYLEEPRIWSETGIWLPVGNDPDVESNILGVFDIMEENEARFRINITDILFDGSLGWETLSNAPNVPKLTGVVGTKVMGDEVVVKVHLGQQKKNVKIIQPVYYSLMKLSSPMDPRRFDYRMSFLIEGMPNHRDRTKNDMGSIVRWRLEKKYKDRQTSVPIRPITFIMSPDIPKQWRPYVKAGILEWLPAFESAGFKDAIVVHEVDSLDEWSSHCLGTSVVRWFRNGNIREFGEKRSGSTVTLVVDQRSGEIIKSDILLGSSYEHLMDAYFIRCSALDERAQTYPFPDELMGELIQSLVAHETGHAFGITDNSYGEYRYPVDKMGDAQWLRTMGHTPSIMNYTRHNNMAQPEDSIPPSLLMQKVGPTDKYYIRWGYQEFPEGWSAEKKNDSLERFIRLQDTIPWYRYTNDQGEFIGPTATDEVVETDDPVKGAKLAMKNLERAMALLPKLNQGQKDNARMERIHREAIELWYFTMRHVFSLVGGYEVFYKSMDQPGKMYDPIPLETQREAMDFLVDQVVAPPEWLARPTFSTYSRFTTFPDELFTYQQLLVQEMLKPKLMKRLQYMETIQGFEGVMNAYFVQLQRGLFSELNGKGGFVEPRKQGLQAAYIDWLVKIVLEESTDVKRNLEVFAQTDYAKGMMMGQLIQLKKQMDEKLRQERHLEQKGHWALCLAKLEKVLQVEPK
ncbi:MULTISPECIES: zinc-dependent metalloprotease [Flagellimonas]|nr:zinc-dependent metalloprotease [Allomuricauda olearia]